MDLNKELEKVGELTRKSNDLLEKLGVLKLIESKEEILFNKQIAKIGSGSHVILHSDHIGKSCAIIIQKREETKK